MSGDVADLNRSGKSSPGSLPTRVGPLFYWSAVTVIFVWAAWLRFRLPLDPIAVTDYLEPGLRKLTGAGFGYIPLDRTIIYPAFVYLVLHIFEDFRAITIIQHLLALLAGGILLLTWQRIRDFLPSPHLPYPIHSCLGLLAAAIYLFAAEPLCFEISIRPEGICAFLISINLYFVIQFIGCCFLEGRQRATVVYGVAVVFSSILLASVKPSFWLTAIVALLPVAAFLLRRESLRQKILLAGGAAASTALLLLPERFVTRNNLSECFLPTQLFVIHANLIRDQMADDLERNANVPYPREWLERIHAALAEEIATSFSTWPGHYPTLGFDPDYIMYNPASIVAQLQKEFVNNVSALCAFYWYYYWRIWLQRPVVVTNKVMRQMAIFYAPSCPAYRSRKSLSLTNDYKRSITSLGTDSYRKVWSVYPPVVEFMSRIEALARSEPVVEQPAYIRRPLGILAVTYRPLLLIALALSVAVFLYGTARRQLGWLASIMVFAYSYSAANCLEVAIVHSLDNPRYITVQMYFAILAQFVAVLLILEVLLGSRALIGGKSSRPNDVGPAKE
jgi:hypothetical protein